MEIVRTLRNYCAFILVTAATFNALPGSCTKVETGSTVQIAHLRCENLANPLGIDATTPRLSWILLPTRPEARNLKQTSYRVLVASSLALLDKDEGDLWDTGKVNSSQSTQLHYTGKPLGSQQNAWWKVKAWDQDDKPSAWSSAATWSMGLLKESDWNGKWIGVRGGDGASEELHGARWVASKQAGQGMRWFRCRFEISPKDPVSYGLLAAAGSGEITVYVNGQKINSPFGRFPHGYASQDVTGILHIGWNSLAIQVNSEAFSPAVIAGITLDREDGEIDHVQSNDQWKAADTEENGWERPEFNDAQWQGVKAIADMPLPVTGSERTRLPARMLRKEFRLAAAPHEAKVYISGLGYFEIYINGSKISNDVLAPGLTDYDKRVLYVTYDVTKYLHAGANAVGILLGNGRFFSPRLNTPVRTRSFNYPEARLQLEVESTNGHETVATDETWKATTDGPIRANNDYDGEEYDARMEQRGWATAGFNDRKWIAAQAIDAPAGVAHSQMNEPVRVTRELKPVKMIQSQPGVYLFDMGQTMVGWSRLQVAGPAGTKVTLRYAESLRPGEQLYTDNLRSARQTDVYTLKGGGPEVFEPRFTEHGYRYVEVRGYPGVPTLAAINGRVVNDALDEHADFVTSNGTINAIYRTMLWGDRGNYRSIPTDCPQRDERQGWLGDRSAESTGETFLFNVEDFYAKWMNDIDDSQDKDGRLNDVAPAYWPFYNENVVWPATFFIVTEMLHEQYGDDEPIHAHYPAMKRWVAHMRTLMKGDLLPVDTYGDWCVPPLTLDMLQDNDPAAATSPEILGTTYFYYLLRLMSHFAAINEQVQDQQEYDALAEKIKMAFNAKYFNAQKNLYDNGSQTSSVIALAFDIAPQDRREALVANLIDSIEHHMRGHVGVGIVGQQWLMQTLTNNGHIDVAYQLAKQTTYPSWGYMLSQNATTIWELWNGNVAGPSMNSGNHLMLLGDLSTWMYEDLAGIRTDVKQPGFKHILVQPQIVGDLEFVRASHDSPYGRIATDWNRAGDHLTLRVTIPPNTTATVYVPGNSRDVVREGGTVPETVQGVHFVESVPGATVYEVGSGQYVFTSTVEVPRSTLNAALAESAAAKSGAE
jgi:alpha-L-rhamnosidase